MSSRIYNHQKYKRVSVGWVGGRVGAEEERIFTLQDTLSSFHFVHIIMNSFAKYMLLRGATFFEL